MGDNWMTPRRIHIGASDLDQLPRHPNWRYESLPGGEMALLVPKPRFGHALLDMERWRPGGGMKDVGFRSWEPQDPEELASLFSQSFETSEPLAGLSRKERNQASREALTEAYGGAEGPVSSASIVALNEGNSVGAALITLLPGGNLDAPGSWRWQEPAPPDLEFSGAGQPHLTWIFVDPHRHHEGIAAAMLNFCIRKLRTLGYRTLASTFLTGNHASVLWHWRMGFTLMSWPGSPRWRHGV